MLIAFKRPGPFSLSVTPFPFPVRTYDLDHSFMEVAALARLARAFVRREVKVQCPRLFAWDRQKAYDRALPLMETKRTFDLHLLAEAKALIFGEGKR